MKYFFLILYISISIGSESQNIASTSNNRRIQFIPSTFSNSFSLNNTPVLTINSGDTVMTEMSLVEATQVISTSIEYTIAEIADPNVEVVAKIRKEILKGLKK